MGLAAPAYPVVLVVGITVSVTSTAMRLHSLISFPPRWSQRLASMEIITAGYNLTATRVLKPSLVAVMD